MNALKALYIYYIYLKKKNNILIEKMFSNLTKNLTEKILITLRQTYKSSISLDKLYPKSNLDALTQPNLKVFIKKIFFILLFKLI